MWGSFPSLLRTGKYPEKKSWRKRVTAVATALTQCALNSVTWVGVWTAADLQGFHLGPSRLSSCWNDFCPIGPAHCHLCHKFCLKSLCSKLLLMVRRPGRDCNSQHAFATCHFSVLQKLMTIAFNKNISRALWSQLLLTQSNIRSIMVSF